MKWEIILKAQFLILSKSFRLVKCCVIVSFYYCARVEPEQLSPSYVQQPLFWGPISNFLIGIVISVLSQLHTHLFSYVCSTHSMHSLHTCKLHNSETLEPLTWARVWPSNCCEHTLKRSHVLYRLCLTSVNIHDIQTNPSCSSSYKLSQQQFTPYWH